MSKLGTFLLVHVFTAVLPPKDSDDPEDEYYTVLGLGDKKSKSTADEIKKAYRKISLQMHPDKIAQRGGDPQEAAAKYEKVQQAYSVLQDAQERSKYHAVKCSPKRYKFVYQQGWTHPMSIFENVTQASCVDRFRLVLVVFVILAALLVQPILIAAKVNKTLDDNDDNAPGDWVHLLIPFWILYGLYMLLQLVLVVLSRQRDYLMDLLTSVTFYVGLMLLAQAWDDGTPLEDKNWNKLAVPFYLAVLFRVGTLAERAAGLGRLQARFVSPEEMIEVTQRAVEQNNQQELTPEEMETLQKDFIVVTPNEMTVAATLAVLEAAQEEISDEDVEAIKVQSSPEFTHTQQQILQTQANTAQWLILGITQIALIAARVEENITTSWWVVFLPLWLNLGGQFLSSCFVCLCVGPGGDELAQMVVEEDDDEDENAGASGEPEANNDADGEPTKESASMDESKDEDEKDDAAPPETAKDSNEDEDKEEMTTTEDEQQNEPGAPPSSGEAEKSDETTHSKDQAEDNNMPKEGDELAEESSSSKVREAGSAIYEPPEGEFIAKEEAAAGEEPKDNDSKTAEDFDEETGFGDADQEEAFRQWARAQAQQDDNTAVEKAARAQYTCCVTTFQLTTCLLIVAKLDQDFDDAGDGFNCFWILFPTFMIAGIVFCCCGCIVYGVGPSTMEEFLREQGQATDNADGQSNDEAEEGDNPAEGDATAAEQPPEDSHQGPTDETQLQDEKPIGETEVGASPQDDSAAAAEEKQAEPKEDINDLD